MPRMKPERLRCRRSERMSNSSSGSGTRCPAACGMQWTSAAKEPATSHPRKRRTHCEGREFQEEDT